MILLFNILCLLLMTGCSKDNVIHGVYDGFRVRNDLQSSPPERDGRPESPDYTEYERMRKERSKQKSER